MVALPLILTEAGLAAIVDAEAGGTAAVVIAEIGLAPAPFDASDETVEIPDEIKRLDALSGAAVDSTTVHLTARDHSSDEYEFYGFGVYLADGTLFGVYSQAEAIAGKAAVSLLYMAFDFKLSAPLAENFVFGDANFLNPPATEETLGVVRRASLEEVQDGEDVEKFVSPALLAAVYVALEQLGVPNGVATLGVDGKLVLAQRPPIDPIDFWFVGSEAEMLALATASVGDWAIRSDTDPTEIYVLQDLPATDIANWLSLNIPAPVTSVNGKVGAVMLDYADVGAPPVARTITGSGLATGGGSLAANRVLDVPKASAEETVEGLIDTKAVTPASLAAVLAAIGAGVPADRTITGGGLVTGGGSLAANRVLTVAKATVDEAFAGVLDDRAVTPASLAGFLYVLGLKAWGGTNLTTSGLVTGGGNLFADRNFDVQRASAAEALAAAIDTKAVTPASLSSIVSQLNAKALKTTTVTGAGLASGGGALSANQVITVNKASGAEALAMANDTKAITPLGLASVIRRSGSGSTLVAKIGSIVIQIFQGSIAGTGATSFSFPEAFPSTCVGAFVNGGTTSDEDNGPYVSSKSNTGCTVFNANNAHTGQIIAIGY